MEVSQVYRLYMTIDHVMDHDWKKYDIIIERIAASKPA